MTPHYSDDWLTVYGGDCRTIMEGMPADSVDCVVTSPPYWGLRDYGSEGQLGLERTPEEYVANMVAVFREVRRVLKPSGTCWLNLGDSYSSGTGGDRSIAGDGRSDPGKGRPRSAVVGMKPKDLVGIPWRVAFALQADGWYLRSEIIWSKPNPMPESVTDRPTKSHEQLFLLTKSARYYFDADAVRESAEHREWRPDRSNAITAYPGGEPNRYSDGPSGYPTNPAGRNIRSVWTIATRPYPGAHFAVFPPELPERCIKAGSSERGVCPECGAPWDRVVERNPGFTDGKCNGCGRIEAQHIQSLKSSMVSKRGQAVPCGANSTAGWRPTCAHGSCNCYNDSDETTDGHLPDVLQGVRSERASPAGEVLLSDVLIPVRREDATSDQGIRDLGEGLQASVASEPSDGDEDGLSRGASAGNGRDVGTDADSGRGGRSHQRRQDGQPSREPASADEEGTRRDLEQGPSEDGELPRLRQSLPAQGTCGQCGGYLQPLAPAPSVILDCFAGSGTVGLVANRLSRRAILIDLNPEYLEQQMKRNAQTPLGLGAA